MITTVCLSNKMITVASSYFRFEGKGLTLEFLCAAGSGQDCPFPGARGHRVQRLVVSEIAFITTGIAIFVYQLW